MTTAIIAIVEHERHGVWVRYGRVLRGEGNVNLFAILAGVRNYAKVKPLSHARGLPEDYGAFDAADFTDCHTTSWLTTEELSIISGAMAPNGEPLEDFIGVDACIALEGITSVRDGRMVFGFVEL